MDFEIPQDIQIKICQIRQCKNNAMYYINTVKLISSDINIYKLADCFTRSGVEVPKAKYLNQINIKDYPSIGEIGVVVESQKDIDIVKEFDEENEQIYKVFLLATGEMKNIIKENFNLGNPQSIMSLSVGKYIHIKKSEDEIKNLKFSLQGIVIPDKLEFLKNISTNKSSG